MQYPKFQKLLETYTIYIDTYDTLQYTAVEKLGSKWSTLALISPKISTQNPQNFSQSCLQTQKILKNQKWIMKEKKSTEKAKNVLLVFAKKNVCVKKIVLINAKKLVLKTFLAKTSKQQKQARKLGRCDSNLQNLKTLLTDPIGGVGARRCYRIQKWKDAMRGEMEERKAFIVGFLTLPWQKSGRPSRTINLSHKAQEGKLPLHFSIGH